MLLSRAGSFLARSSGWSDRPRPGARVAGPRNRCGAPVAGSPPSAGQMRMLVPFRREQKRGPGRLLRRRREFVAGRYYRRNLPVNESGDV